MITVWALTLTLTSASAQIPPEAVPARELVGFTLEEVAVQWSTATVIYEMSHRAGLDANLQPIHYGDALLDGPWTWPAHGMKWKDYMSGQGHGLDLVAAEASAYGTDLAHHWTFGAHCQGGQVPELNAMEAGGSVFASDPAGGWMCSVQSDPLQGMVFSALAMHYWGTPVYVGYGYNYLGTSWTSTYTTTAGLRELEFFVVGTHVNDLHDACGLVGASPSQALAGVGSCGGVTLTSAEAALFNDSICGGCSSYLPYEEARTFSGADALMHYASSQGLVGHLVFDPPAGVDEEEVAALVELAEIVSGELLVEGTDGVLRYAEEVVVEASRASTEERRR